MLGVMLWLLILGSCKSGSPTLFVPQAPDYNDASQWFVSLRDTTSEGADFFYIVSTETADWTDSVTGQVSHFADTYNPEVCKNMTSEMAGVDALLNESCNYYSPYYRQVTMNTWEDDALGEECFKTAMEDVRHAWDFFLQHHNNGRPIVLAGFSQGARAAKELLKEMPNSVMSRIVATYLFGYSVSQEELDTYPNLLPAKGETDTGVIICYNSVKGAECAGSMVSKDNVVCINPLNWRTDSIPAQVLTVGSPFKPAEEQPIDTLSVHVDNATHTLFVKGYTGNDHVLPLMDCEGNYHSREIWFYRESLRKNIEKRVQKFLISNR